MKKLALLTLSMFMLLSTVQPALAVLTDDMMKQKRARAFGAGIGYGLMSGMVNGLATAGALRLSSHKNNNLLATGLPSDLKKAEKARGKAMVGLLGLNLIAPQYINRYFGRNDREFLKQADCEIPFEFVSGATRKIRPTNAQKKELRKIMERSAFWTDAVVTSGLISGLASGSAKTMFWSEEPEGNSFKNFCVTLPFVFASVTALKYGSYKLHKWMHGK